MGALCDWQIKRDVKIEPFQEGQVSKSQVSWGCGSNGYDVRVGFKFKVFTPTHCGVVDPKDFDPKSFVDFDLTPPAATHEWVESGETSQTFPGNYRLYRCKNCGVQADTSKSDVCPNAPKKPDHVLIPPNSFALGETVERLEIPRDVVALCVCKSTYARVGVLIPTTILEPEWKGIVTLEIANTTSLPAKVYVNEGICQVVFLRSDGLREFAYQHHLNHLVMRHGDLSSGTEANNEWVRKHGSCTTSYADKRGRYQDQSGLTLPFVEKENKDGG